MASPMPGLATLVARVLVGGLSRYRSFVVSALPALLAIVVPLKVGALALGAGAASPADRLPASLFALQLTVLGIIASYALLPLAAAGHRGRSVRPTPTLALEPHRRAVLVSSLLLLGMSLRLGPTGYALPALAVVTLFWTAWPWLRRQSAVGGRLLRRGTRSWRRSRPAEKLTAALALLLAQAALIALGRATAVAAGALGGPQALWVSKVFLTTGFLPLHLLALVALGAELAPARPRA